MERKRLRGFVRRPNIEEILELAESEYMHPDDEDLEELQKFFDIAMGAMDVLDDASAPEIPVKYKERDKGYRPTPEEDPYNVFIRKCLVKGAPSGKLAGVRVGVKDNIKVAGVPMSNASRFMHGYVPDIDATIVEKMLDEGASVIGKLNMDEFSLNGTGESSFYGYMRNPHNPEYSAAGSSGGSGAAVALGEVDLAIGGDQGGSGRLPASWCGVVSMKPTHGLVSTFGLTYMDFTIDSLCPMARSVEEVARALEVVAGEDPRDPQWERGAIKVDEYTKSLRTDVKGVKIGVIKESMETQPQDADVIESVRDAVRKLESLGAEVSEVSFPDWWLGVPVWYGFVMHAASAMLESNMEGYWRRGMCDVRFQEAVGQARRANSDDLSPFVRYVHLAGKYLRQQYHSTYYSKATNLRYKLTQYMNKLLEEVDVLVTPTTPIKAVKLVTEPPFKVSESGPRTVGAAPNTIFGNITGHPALVVPTGFGENNLPMSMQLYGRSFEESTLFRVGHTWEQRK